MPLLSREVTNQILFSSDRRAEIARVRQGLSGSAKLDNWQLVEAWATVGECHKFEREPQLAEEAYKKALEAIHLIGDEGLLAEGYADLGNAMYFCKQYERAVRYYHQATAILERLSESDDELYTVLSQVAYCYAAMGKREDERAALNKGIMLPGPHPTLKALLLERIAVSLGESGQYQEAVKAYERALAQYEADSYKREWSQRLENLAQLYRALGDEEAAKRTLRRR